MRGVRPMLDLPLSACVISTLLQRPASIAAAAWRTCSMNEQPPTEVPSTQVGVMPRECAICCGVSTAVAMPSMSDNFSPASAMAFSAASACNWICDTFGMTPSSVVSAAPTTATWFLRMMLALCRTEQGEGDGVIQLFEFHLQLHVEFERFRRLRAIDDVRHHARALVEFDHGDRI